MRAYVMDAFAKEVFSGNQAGAVIVENELDEALMKNIAAEFKHSETAFIRVIDEKNIVVRYFTPEAEVDLCGHATVAAFSLLRRLGVIGIGEYTAHTKAGKLKISVGEDCVWMDMAPPRFIRELTDAETAELFEAYSLDKSDCAADMRPAIVSTGLADIIMPVKDRAALKRAVQNSAAVCELSRRFDCVGVHMFALDEGCTAFCSNFAPLYGIEEECATGTANAALTYYLYRASKVKVGEVNRFLQGEHMGRPSSVFSIMTETEAGPRVRIGGDAVISIACDILIDE